MITPSFGLTATERALPRMALDFTTASLDSRITFTRSLATATVVNSSGYVETVSADTPRFDYDPLTLVCKGLLIEESRINTVTYSEDFSTNWNLQRSLVSKNSVVAPNNTQTADTITGDGSAGGQMGVYQTISASSSTAYSLSVFAKAGTCTWLVINSFDGSTNPGQWFNLSTGVVGSTGSGLSSPKIEAFPNGWYRCSVIRTTGASATSLRASYMQGDGDNVYAGSPLTLAFYLWGAQCELGAFPTSYIPNLATGTTTRNADVATMTGTNFSDWFNASEGALFAEASQPVIFATSKQAASLNDGTSTNRIMLYRQAAGSINGIVIPSGQVFLSSGVTAAANTTWKQMFAYTTVRGTYAANGVLGTDVLYPIPSSVLNTLTIGAGYPGSNDFLNGHIKKIMYYPIKLTNAEVVAFTKL